MNPKLERLAALGAFGVCAGVFALWVALLWLMHPTLLGGIDRTEFHAAVLATACPAALLIAIHIVLARQLIASSRRI